MTVDTTPETDMPGVHLFLLIHGLWGKPTHLDVAHTELEAAWDAALEYKDHIKVFPKHFKSRSTTPPNIDSGANSPYASPNTTTSHLPPADDIPSFSSPTKTAPGDELVVVVAEGMTAKLTYDGVDVCASRVAWEVDQHIMGLELEGKRVTKFSILGYSLGGLVARYLVGLLNARTPSFFDRSVPVSFTTIATPHLGIPRYNTFLSSALGTLGGHLMSRTGEQIYVADKYSDADPRPLLEIMADPKHVFHQGLSRFSQVLIYANVVNDSTVPFPSAAIEATDPFVQWMERGLEVEADEIGLVSDWHYPALDKKPSKEVWPYHLGTLPPIFRFRWPFNYIILALFPILFPILFILILVRFSLDTARSRKRLQRLARVDATTPASPTSPSSPIPSHHGLSIDGLREAIRAVERNIEQDLIQAAEYDLGHGPMEPLAEQRAFDADHAHHACVKPTLLLDTDTDDPHAPIKSATYEAKPQTETDGGCTETNGSSTLRKRHITTITEEDEATDRDKHTNKSASTTTLLPAARFFPEPTINVRMAPSQTRMIAWLNALAPTKFLAWYPDVPNAHAVIIAREPQRIAIHERGRGMIRHWAGIVVEAAMAQ